jgi:hypothetical protein
MLMLMVRRYVLIAFSEILASITGLEYAFTKAPTNMRSLVMSVFLFMSAASAAIGEAFVCTSSSSFIVICGQTLITRIQQRSRSIRCSCGTTRSALSLRALVVSSFGWPCVNSTVRRISLTILRVDILSRSEDESRWRRYLGCETWDACDDDDDDDDDVPMCVLWFTLIDDVMVFPRSSVRTCFI